MNGTAGRLGQVKRSRGTKNGGAGGGSLAGKASDMAAGIAGLASSLVLSVIISVAMQKCCGSGEKRMVTLSHSISILFILLGLAVTGVAVYLLALAMGVLAGLPFLSPVGCAALLVFGIAILLQGGMVQSGDGHRQAGILRVGTYRVHFYHSPDICSPGCAILHWFPLTGASYCRRWW